MIFISFPGKSIESRAKTKGKSEEITRREFAGRKRAREGKEHDRKP